ncbi:hypothetical protein, partial [Acidithiobacillus caldus]|uniref:hypothetical protein n=1 Tax=Acidithiobacillus caldus TaxID=33059 RepID=UPI001A7E0AC0
ALQGSGGHPLGLARLARTLHRLGATTGIEARGAVAHFIRCTGDDTAAGGHRWQRATGDGTPGAQREERGVLAVTAGEEP